MKISKVLSLFASAVSASCALAVAPSITGVSMSQGGGSRLVTINYTLADAPAVITLDVVTNVVANATSDSDEWASIGGEAIWNATGDVWKKVGASLTEGNTFNGTITWRPDLSWPGHKLDGSSVQARAVVTAYATDNPPDYMVVDLTASGGPDTEEYYPGADFLPKSDYDQVGAITNNPAYKTTKIVLRKIMAKNIKWTMGSYADGKEPSRSVGTTTSGTFNTGGVDSEAAHQVELTNNYYIAVFETTQEQWALVVTNSWPSFYTNATDRAYRPVEKVSYANIRARSATATGNSIPDTTHFWPNDPHPDSFLGILDNVTGLKFDLPSEAQWEFACRAGNGNGNWGNGEPIDHTGTGSVEDGNLAHIGRYNKNYGTSDKDHVPASEGGTAIVGSYQPNSWGIYDMHGNVYEICLDWQAWNITSLGGKVNLDPTNPNGDALGNTYEFTSNQNVYRVRRGGAFGVYASNCRSAMRLSGLKTTNSGEKNTGFRIVCPLD